MMDPKVHFEPFKRQRLNSSNDKPSIRFMPNLQGELKHSKLGTVPEEPLKRRDAKLHEKLHSQASKPVTHPTEPSNKVVINVRNLDRNNRVSTASLSD
jgi:hypothetical protein